MEVTQTLLRISGIIASSCTATIRDNVYRSRQEYKYHTLRHRRAITVQCFFRRFLQVRRRLRRLQEMKFLRYRIKCATRIQSAYRGLVGRKKVVRVRNERANQDLRAAKRRAVQEVKATVIQCCFHCMVARVRVAALREARRQRIERDQLENLSASLIARIARGFMGRCNAYWRREELLHSKLR